ncbi:stalled ribosome sensor GCN1-like, partial [Clytia hemisphaerica]
ELEGTKALILSVEDEVGIRTIIDELLSALKKQNPGIRKVGASLLAVFCKSTPGDYSMYVQQLFRVIINSMNDVDTNVVGSAWQALDALVKHLDPSEQLQHLPSLKQAIKFVKSDIRNNELPGFCILKKGVTPVLPIFREGILNGPQDVKEQAARLLGEIIQLTSAAALKPSVVHITGPLIRILGDRFNWNVKEAILDTLGLLLEKVGIMLKPFLPQLQTTFVKALNDPTQAVREKAAWALGLLTVLHTRVDSLFTELKNGIKNNEDSGIRETTLKALRTIILKGGKKMSEAVRVSILEVLEDLLDSSEDGVRVNTGAALGALCQIMTNDEIQNLLKNSLTNVNPALDWTVSHGRVVALSYALFDAPQKLFESMGENENIINAVIKFSTNDRVPICTYGVHCLGHLLLHSKEDSSLTRNDVMVTMKKALVHTSNDIKLTSLKTIKYISKTEEAVLDFNKVKNFIPELVALLRDRNTAVKSSAELTLGFMLQLHRNDQLFDECVTNLPDQTKILQDYRQNAFVKLSDSFATEGNDYPFVT